MYFEKGEIQNEVAQELRSDPLEFEAEKCEACAQDHEQLADWLEELKRRRADDSVCTTEDPDQEERGYLTEDKLLACHRLQMSICKIILDMPEDIIWDAIVKASEGKT